MEWETWGRLLLHSVYAESNYMICHDTELIMSRSVIGSKGINLECYMHGVSKHVLIRLDRS